MLYRTIIIITLTVIFYTFIFIILNKIKIEDKLQFKLLLIFTYFIYLGAALQFVYVIFLIPIVTILIYTNDQIKRNWLLWVIMLYYFVLLFYDFVILTFSVPIITLILIIGLLFIKKFKPMIKIATIFSAVVLLGFSASLISYLKEEARIRSLPEEEQYWERFEKFLERKRNESELAGE